MNPGGTPGVSRGRPSRRALLGGSAALAATFGGLAVVPDLRPGGEASEPTGGASGPVGNDPAAPARVSFYGPHQAGVITPQQAHASFLGLDLRAGADATSIGAMLVMLTDDAARLCSGRRPLGALEDADDLRHLTVTFGFGAGLFAAAGVPKRCPEGVRGLPAFSRDRLESRWGQTDLVLQVAADDPTALAYAQRRLLRDAAHLTTTRWVQRGFVTPAAGASPRNLLGMRDGSANPRDPEQVAQIAWSRGPGAMAGGSQLVLRRVRLALDRWDDVETATKELAFGRRVADGSPLSAPAGASEFTAVDRAALDGQGFTVVPPHSHAARAQARSAGERMLRRGYNYDDGAGTDGAPDAGLLFVAYQADARTAFVPVQRRLDEADALNVWSTHVGSAVYAIPPGIPADTPGEWVGRALLT